MTPIFSTCEGSKCPSKDNCRRHTDRKNTDAVPAALWIRREAGSSACDLYLPIDTTTTFKD